MRVVSHQSHRGSQRTSLDTGQTRTRKGVRQILTINPGELAVGGRPFAWVPTADVRDEPVLVNGERSPLRPVLRALRRAAKRQRACKGKVREVITALADYIAAGKEPTAGPNERWAVCRKDTGVVVSIHSDLADAKGEATRTHKVRIAERTTRRGHYDYGDAEPRWYPRYLPTEPTPAQRDVERSGWAEVVA